MRADSLVLRKPRLRQAAKRYHKHKYASMKHLIVFLICILSFGACRQKSVIDFDVSYKPNSIYSISSESIIKTIILFQSSFEISQNVDSLNIAGKDFEIKGRGTGYCEYDIRNKYITKYQTSTNTDMKLKMYGQIMKVNSNSIYNQETSLKN